MLTGPLSPSAIRSLDETSYDGVEILGNRYPTVNDQQFQPTPNDDDVILLEVQTTPGSDGNAAEGHSSQPTQNDGAVLAH